MSNSPLVNYTKLSPNYTPRNDKIRKITIHHVAGNASVESLGAQFFPVERKGSSNYGVGTDGRVGMYVEEKNRAWTSGSPANDHQAITIETANDGGAPDWHVSDTALNKLIELCVDICKRNGIERLVYTGDKNGNLTRHNMFMATACPGAYLQSKFPYIAEQVNIKLGIASPPIKEVDIEPFQVKTQGIINIRDKPDGKDIGDTKTSDIYNVTKTAKDSQGREWYYITFGWVAGWLCNKYSAQVIGVDVQPFEVKTQGIVNIRETPNGKDVGDTKTSDIYTVTKIAKDSQGREWYFIKSGWVAGWLCKKYYPTIVTPPVVVAPVKPALPIPPAFKAISGLLKRLLKTRDRI